MTAITTSNSIRVKAVARATPLSRLGILRRSPMPDSRANSCFTVPHEASRCGGDVNQKLIGLRLARAALILGRLAAMIHAGTDTAPEFSQRELRRDQRWLRFGYAF